jgi:hypothetical protein
MPTSRSFSQREPYAGRGELVGLIRRVQALTLELAELRQQGRASRELEAKELPLEQLRWRLATVTRRTAADGLGAAA